MRKIIIIDFGGQYAHLIARRIRELNRLSVMVAGKKGIKIPKREEAGALILSGGPRSVNKEDIELANEILEISLSEKIPIMGICYGHQLLAKALGGSIERKRKEEYGSVNMKILKEDPIFNNVPSNLKVWMSHSDSVSILPQETEVLALTENEVVAAFRHLFLPIYGLQFHPEVKHTEMGKEILENFLSRVAGIGKEWFPVSRATAIIEELKERMKEGDVLAAVSGGVDSITAAVLVSRAVGKERIHALLIDTGLLREGEIEEAKKALSEAGIMNIYIADKSKEFLSRLKGITDPEEKRRAVSETFARAFEEFASNLASRGIKLKYLVQGTIYPDRIESGAAGAGAEKIKSHHNVAMRTIEGLDVIEPLSEFYKDEVREIARSLGIPNYILKKHPFPGPGLAIRIIGEISEENLKKVRKATKIVEEELRKFNLYEHVWQAFAVLLPIKTVGIKGDSRSYEEAVAIRIVESEDGMTASVPEIPWGVIERIASRIVNEVPGVNRVLFDATTKPPATIEFE
ncbi:MAG: glutamine-hydrolyzing GMP synthase [Fervidicoccaceae archaeon]